MTFLGEASVRVGREKASPGRASVARGGGAVETKGRNQFTKHHCGAALLYVWLVERSPLTYRHQEGKGNANCHHVGPFTFTLTCLYPRPAKDGAIPFALCENLL